MLSITAGANFGTVDLDRNCPCLALTGWPTKMGLASHAGNS